MQLLNSNDSSLTCNDIEELRQKEAALETENIKLRENAIRYCALFQSISDSIIIMNEDRFLDCNQATEELFGCTHEEIIGNFPYNFSPTIQPDGWDSKEKALEKIHAAMMGEPQFFEWVHTRKDRKPFYAEVSLNCFCNTNEKRLLAIVRDITERKLAEEELKSHVKEIETLHEVAVTINQSKGLEQLLQTYHWNFKV